MRKLIISVTAAVVGAVLLCGCAYFGSAPSDRLEQNGDILIYDGAEYMSSLHTDIIADIHTSGYLKVGRISINFSPYLPVYANQAESPEYLVYHGGKIVYFLKERFPNRLRTEYTEICLTHIESNSTISISGPLTMSQYIRDPMSYAIEDPARDVYTYVLRIDCDFVMPSGATWYIEVHEKDGIYYLLDHGNDLQADDYYKYHPVIEGSYLHTLILETIAAGQSPP